MIGFGIFMIGQAWIFPEGGTRKCNQLWDTVADGSCQAARSKEHRYAKKETFWIQALFCGQPLGKMVNLRHRRRQKTPEEEQNEKHQQFSPRCAR